MTNANTWRPLATNDVIKRRALLYRQIREFMATRQIMEVDTPILASAGITDPFIDTVTASASLPDLEHLYLHSSPEFCMKRLLAAGSGDIFQIAHVFRNGEQGRRHTIEFTMLEWYRLGMDYHQLMDEVAALLETLGLETPTRVTYADIFEQAVKVHPLQAETAELMALARNAGWDAASDDRHELLDFLFSHRVNKEIRSEKSLMIHDYPACMSVLSKIKADNSEVCERFELFLNGMEVANGFSELSDPLEQRERFLKDIELRKQKQLPVAPLDEHFLAALEHGLPECAGVAVGLDRLLMVLSGSDDIHDMHTFTLKNN